MVFMASGVASAAALSVPATAYGTYPGVVLFPVCIASGSQEHPAVSGHIVVWCDDRNGNEDIYGYNVATMTEFPVCVAPGDQWEPAISGDIVVWSDGRDSTWDIYGYNLATKATFPVATGGGQQVNPAISGDLVVWESLSSSLASDIYGCYLSNKNAFPVCTADQDQSDPAVSGDTVVWQDSRNGNEDIYGYNVATGTEFPVCVADRAQDEPAISGPIIVWQDERNPAHAYDTYGYDLRTRSEFLVSVSSHFRNGLAIDGDTVAWYEGSPGRYGIWGHNLSTKTEFRISANTSFVWPRVAVSGDYVVWPSESVAGPTAKYHVYGAKLVPDTLGPTTKASAVKTWVGWTTTLRFKIVDLPPSCGQARVIIQIKKNGRVIKTLSAGKRDTNVALTKAFKAKLKTGIYTYRVLATDIAGNRATKVGSARLTVRRW